MNTSISESRGYAYSKYRPWRKVLYERQEYPDNYIDEHRFLEHLDVTTLSHPTSFFTLIVLASLPVQQFTILTLFLAAYKYTVRDEDTAVWYVASLDLFLLLTGYLIFSSIQTSHPSHLFTRPFSLSLSSSLSLFSNLLPLLYLRAASPVLQTLTSSFSSDTIHALSLSLSTIHLIAFDYQLINEERERERKGNVMAW